MSDFLNNLAARTLDQAETVQPRPVSLFEPLHRIPGPISGFPLSLGTDEGDPSPGLWDPRQPTDSPANLPAASRTPATARPEGPPAPSAPLTGREAKQSPRKSPSLPRPRPAIRRPDERATTPEPAQSHSIPSPEDSLAAPPHRTARRRSRQAGAERPDVGLAGPKRPADSAGDLKPAPSTPPSQPAPLAGLVGPVIRQTVIERTIVSKEIVSAGPVPERPHTLRGKAIPGEPAIRQIVIKPGPPTRADGGEVGLAAASRRRQAAPEPPSPEAPRSPRQRGSRGQTAIVAKPHITPYVEPPAWPGRIAQPRSRGSWGQAEVPEPTRTIQVSIGRIEIRATPPPGPQAGAQRSKAPVMSLDEYLRQRSNGGDR